MLFFEVLLNLTGSPCYTGNIVSRSSSSIFCLTRVFIQTTHDQILLKTNSGSVFMGFSKEEQRGEVLADEETEEKAKKDILNKEKVNSHLMV